ncbi:MAG: NAD(+)/NADH kinase [Planctomycetes bacterium]|nr:NAD(+)/NADH kinase [Planctomycetota bacterium]MBL7187403.1 NAD(+)/NADH kinase [Phycisphaerae bacterium]
MQKMKPDDGYIAYIVNPKAGASSSKLTGRRFERYLVKNGYGVKVHMTRSLEHARELATNAGIDYDCAMVIVVGGDGTVREVAHGLEGSDKPLLIVPHGTENLLANELGFDETLKTLIRTFEAEYVRPLDLGRANGRCFTSIAGFGFDGDIVKRVSDRREGHIRHSDYFWPIWRTFWNYKFDPMRVEVDGEEIFDGRGLVFVGNISRYAVGLQILHYADFGDGLLDVCVYKCASQLHLAKHSLLTIFKHHADRKDVIYRQGKNISVSSGIAGIQTEIDGDPGPALPVEISVIRHAVNCVVPENAKPAGMRTRIVRAIG